MRPPNRPKSGPIRPKSAPWFDFWPDRPNISWTLAENRQALRGIWMARGKNCHNYCHHKGNCESLWEALLAANKEGHLRFCHNRAKMWSICGRFFSPWRFPSCCVSSLGLLFLGSHCPCTLRKPLSPDKFAQDQNRREVTRPKWTLPMLTPPPPTEY